MNSVSPRSDHFPSLQQWSPIGAVAGGIFLIDLFIPLGVAVGVLHITAVLLSLRHRDTQLPLWTAIACSTLTIMALFISPVGGEYWKVLLNRALALLAIWTTTLMGRVQLQQVGTIQQQGKTMNDFIRMLPAACFSFDRQGTILSWNPAAEKIYGYTEQEVVGASNYDLVVTPGGLRSTQAIIGKVFQGETVVNQIWHGQNKQGEQGWRAGSLFPVFDNDGQIAYGVNINIDITAQKIAENNLQTQKALLETILNSTQDAIYAKDESGKYLLANRAAADVMGKPPEDLIGLDDIQIFGPEFGETLQQTDSMIMGNDQTAQLEETIAIQDNLLTFSTTKSPLKTANGKIFGLVGVSRDITEWKKLQTDLLLTERVFQASHDHISILGRDYRYRRVNPTYERIHGYSKQELVGMSVSELLGDEVFDQTVKPKLDQCFQGNDVHYEGWFKFADDQDYYMSVSYLPLVSENTDIEELVVIARDMTDRKRIEEALQANQQQLRTILDAMTNFIGIGSVDGIVMDCNQAPLVMAGLTRDDVIGKRFTDTPWLNFSPKVQEQVRDIIQRVGQGEMVREDYQAWMGENGMVTVDACFVPVKDTAGKVQQIVHSGIDVTDRRRVENALTESEERLKMALEASSSGTWDWNIQTGDVHIGGEWLTSLGYQPGELDSTVNSWKEIIHPDDLPHTKKEMARHFAQETKVYESINRIRMKNGEWRWNYDRGRVVERTTDGKPIRMVGTDTDITVRMEAEEALKHSEQRFRTYFETGLVGMAITSLDKGWLEVNDRLCTIFGYSREELLQKTWAELTYPDDLPSDEAEFNKLLAGTQDSYAMSKRFFRKDGALLYANIYAHAVRKPSGEIDYFTAMVEDITEQKHGEALLMKWAMIFQHTQWGVAVSKGTSSTFEMINEAYARMHGYAIQEMEGMPVAQVFSPDFRTQLPKIIEQIHQDGFLSFESLHHRKDGTTFPAFVTVSAIKDLNGAVLYRVTNVIDISDLKQAQQRLLESRQIYQDLVQTIEGIVWECEFPSHQVTFVSDYAEQYLGYPIHMWHDDPHFLLNMIHPKDRERVSKFCNDATLRKENHVIEYRVIHANREIRWVRDLVTVVIKNDQPVKLRGIMLDITAQQQTENALRESQQQLQNILDYSPNIIFMKDCEGRYLLVNKRCEDLLGLKNENIYGKTAHEIFPQNVAEQFLQHDQQVLLTQQPQEVEERLPHPGGDRTVYSTQFPIFSTEGTLKAICGISTDVTERTKAEEALRQSERLAYSAMNALTAHVCIIDEQGWIMGTNVRWDSFAIENNGHVKMLGKGANYLTVCAQATEQGILEAQKIMDGIIAVLSKEDDEFSLDYECSSATQVRWFTCRITRFPDPGPIRAVVAHYDITKRYLLEEAIRTQATELESEVLRRTQRIQELEQRRMQVEKLAALSQVAAGVAHEINNPLASISQSLVLLKRAISPDHPHYRYMAKVEDCIERIAQITKHLYQLYRPSGPTPAPVDLRICIQIATDIMKEQALKNGIQIQIPSMSEPITSNVSQSELIQVLCNLIHNAIDASAPDGVIKVGLNNEPKSLSIVVIDDGEGIPPEAFPHIFEPFFTTKQNSIDGGMGLGLSISRSLVEAMGGKIDFSTSIGQGTTFTITLPMT